MGWIENSYSDTPNEEPHDIQLIAMKVMGKIPLLSFEKLLETFLNKEDAENIDIEYPEVKGASNKVFFGKIGTTYVAIRTSSKHIGEIRDQTYIKSQKILDDSRNSWKFANDNNLCPKIHFYGYFYLEGEDGHDIYSCIIYDRYLNNLSQLSCTETECCNLTSSIIKVLDKMAKNGYLCYDIKPENTVYIDYESEDTNEKIYDVRLIDWDADFCKVAKDVNRHGQFHLIARLLMGAHFKKLNHKGLFDKKCVIFNQEEIVSLNSLIDDYSTDRYLRKQIAHYFNIDKDTECIKKFMYESLERMTGNKITATTNCKKPSFLNRILGRGGSKANNKTHKKKSKRGGTFTPSTFTFLSKNVKRDAAKRMITQKSRSKEPLNKMKLKSESRIALENKTQKQRSKPAFQKPINVLTPRKKESRPNSKQ